MKLYNLRYSNLILIPNISILPIDETLTYTTIPDQTEQGSIGDEGLYYSSHSTGMGASPSEAI